MLTNELSSVILVTKPKQSSIGTYKENQIMYNSINDAKTALLNSGVCEMFEFGNLNSAANYMYNTDCTPEEAAKFFGVL